MNQVQGSNPINGPQPSNSGRRVTPAYVARGLSAFCQAVIVVVFWLVALVAALGRAFIACRAIWFAVQQAIIALGI